MRTHSRSTDFRFALRAVLPLLLLTLPLTGCARPVPNLWETRRAIEEYHDSGRYEADVRAAADAARAYMESRLAEGAARPALVLDVDETSLSEFAFSRSRGFCYDKAAFDAEEREARLPAVAPVRDLASWAAGRGIAVFFVTGRPDALCPATRENLANAGFPEPAGVRCRPAGVPHSPAEAWKSSARKAIEAEGYDILVTMGDQESDLSGGFAERGFKLPNHVYFIP
ncbi:acid phosphatase (Class B) [Desulfovibrio sp. X2]|uniref:HAD family acid phosphatase n=1 Tax=Desulfovibrio sp. X2 TaxID=941449 RepID=UPI000358A1AD|nr:HAD family acid phosphatase [Desulfovibrio sp. X2]EPR42835.1 acid phosphatase (Class B) [Desulfovibrio sp. X2]